MLNPVYDPMQEAYWTLPMCVSWIAYRKVDAVRQQMNSFMMDNRAWPEPCITMLWMEDTDEDYRSFPRLISCHQAKDALWRALQNGELLAHGMLEGTATHSAIEPIAWLRLEPEEMVDAVRTPYPPYQTTIRYTDVRIARGQVLGLWPSAVGECSELADERDATSGPAAEGPTKRERASSKRNAIRNAYRSKFPERHPGHLGVMELHELVREEGARLGYPAASSWSYKTIVAALYSLEVTQT